MEGQSGLGGPDIEFVLMSCRFAPATWNFPRRHFERPTQTSLIAVPSSSSHTVEQKMKELKNEKN